MNNKQPTWREKWNGLKEWLHRPKTVFDFKDRLRALVLLILLTSILSWLVNKITR